MKEGRRGKEQDKHWAPASDSMRSPPFHTHTKRQPLQGDDVLRLDSQDPICLWDIWGSIQQVETWIQSLRERSGFRCRGGRGVSLRLGMEVMLGAPLPAADAEGHTGLDAPRSRQYCPLSTCYWHSGLMDLLHP